MSSNSYTIDRQTCQPNNNQSPADGSAIDFRNVFYRQTTNRQSVNSA